MRFGTSLGLLAILGTGGIARAGAALDASLAPAKSDPATPAPPAPTGTPAEVADKVEYGIDIRLRSVWLPGSLVGLFVDRAAGGGQNYGYGVDFVRRRGNVELQLGFEYEHLELKEGVYINSGDHVPTDTADYILGPDHAPEKFGWFTAEFTFMNHAALSKNVSFRYGGGAGIGILTGGIYRYDVVCAGGATNASPEPGCVPGAYGGQAAGTADDKSGAPESSPVKYDLHTPVFVVVNAIIGFQFRPTPKAVINIEGGIRTLPFIGMSAGYFF
jgi:hypothetical protein